MKYCVYGASSNKIKQIYMDKAEELGEKMAKRGHSLVFGAGDSGCMGAAARGVHKVGGEIIGIIPSFFGVDGVLYPHCTQVISTETMRERKKLLEEMSDAFIVTPGGIGTFDEFFEIVTLKQLERHNKAIAVLNVDGYYDTLHQTLQMLVKEGFMQEKSGKMVNFYDDVDELLDYIENYEPLDISIEDLKYLR